MLSARLGARPLAARLTALLTLVATLLDLTDLVVRAAGPPPPVLDSACSAANLTIALLALASAAWRSWYGRAAGRELALVTRTNDGLREWLWCVGGQASTALVALYNILLPDR